MKFQFNQFNEILIIFFIKHHYIWPLKNKISILYNFYYHWKQLIQTSHQF